MIHAGIFCFLIILKVKPVAEPAGSRATWVSILFHRGPPSSPHHTPPLLSRIIAWCTVSYKGTTLAAGIRRRRPALLGLRDCPCRPSYEDISIPLSDWNSPRSIVRASNSPRGAYTHARASYMHVYTRHRPAHSSEDSPSLLLYRLITIGRWTLSTIHGENLREAMRQRNSWHGTGELSRKGNRSALVINVVDE